MKILFLFLFCLIFIGCSAKPIVKMQTKEVLIPINTIYNFLKNQKRMEALKAIKNYRFIF
ncbi:hypothetical protein [Helicobacter burdigaliensis]|uniref:hypothetical protein n=1 Tax=Helicobacter burdigaliensis TaxID=2315334 RepID=UPI001E5E9EFD|nr:hypothetical protein [Helicobacter burdigaliensis]